MSTVRFGLQIKQLGVAAMQRDQLIVRTTLNDTPVFDHENPIRQAHSAEAVADEDCRFPPGQRAKVGEDLVLGLRIKSAGRLVEHENTGIAHECSRQRNLLPLAATQLCALLQVLKPPPKHRVVALRELLDDGVGRALAPNKRYCLTCAYGETHVFQGRVCLGVLPWIGEADIAELYVESFYLRC